MQIVTTATAYPPYYFSQQEVLEALKSYWEQKLENVAVLERLHSRTGVGGRYFCRPLEEYAGLDTWRKTNDVWIETASVLVVLNEVMTKRRPAPGTRSILAAMGPGFCAEMLLLEW